MLDVEPAAKHIVSDMPLDEAIKFMASATRHSAASFASPFTYPAYRYIPATYIICEKDLVIPPTFQRQWIERMEQESGRSVSTISMETGHCPNASAPGELVKAIEKAVGV